MSSTQIHSRSLWASCPPVKMFGVGRPSSVSADPSVPPRIAVCFGSSPTRLTASSRCAKISGVVLERVAHVPVLDLRLDLDRAALVGRGNVRRDPAQELDVLVEQVVLEVADDEADLHLGRVAGDHDRVDVALALVRRLRRQPVLRQPVDPPRLRA